MIEIPSVEDKIYKLFSELLYLDDLNKEEIKDVVDDALEESNITMDYLINQIIEGIDNGVSMEKQFEIVKMFLNKK